MPRVPLQSLALLLLLSQLAAGNLLCGPGCTSCPLLGLGTCSACGVGYILLGSRCGCAAGYGSYASPAVSGFPSAPPTCLLATAAADGSAVAATATAADADAATAASAVEPSLLLGGRCSCFLCPAGYSSIGGSISSTACVPVSNPSQMCSGSPPRAANARPFAPKCRGATVGQTCNANCNAGFTGRVQAVCTASAGWQVSGTCSAPAAGACAGRPPMPSGRTFPASCAGAATNYLCRGSQDCPSGQGTAAALSVCLSSGLWSTPEVGLCPGESSASCSGSPPAVPNNQFTGCDNKTAGFICVGQCDTSNGYVGQLLVKCSAGGSWDPPSGSSCTLARCSGLPSIGANGANWPSGCANQQYNYQCVTGCLPGFSGQVSSTCQASGVWADPVSTCSGTAASAGLRCAGLPAAVAGVTWGAACANSASGFVCTGSCASGGTLTSTCSNGGWSQPQGSCP